MSCQASGRRGRVPLYKSGNLQKTDYQMLNPEKGHIPKIITFCKRHHAYGSKKAKLSFYFNGILETYNVMDVPKALMNGLEKTLGLVTWLSCSVTLCSSSS